MRAVDIIAAKRDGAELSREELEFLVGGYVAGAIPDYQVSAWAMAVFFRGMTPRETASLTDVMLRSGEVMDLSGVSGPLVDKHSTGGVGDKTSLVLAPLTAAMGITDPMMSGRALGHTGGTLDKLESIPGYRTDLSRDEFRSILKNCGFAMTGQTKEVVPADRLLYSLRDVTSTVESIPLITASILSKKVAEGADGLVFDVKYGSGAFMKDPVEGEKLALSLVNTGRAMGKEISALLTDMNDPLGRMTGNFLEIEESLDCLEGKGPADLMEVTLELAARMALLASAIAAKNNITLSASSPLRGLGGTAEARSRCEECLKSGKPRELFLKNVELQGGNPAELLEKRGVWRSPVSAEILAADKGYIAGIDAWKVGHAAVSLGVGRNRTGDPVSPTAGIEFHAKKGARVEKGSLVMKVWSATEEGLASALPSLEEAVRYSSAPVQNTAMVLKEL